MYKIEDFVGKQITRHRRNIVQYYQKQVFVQGQMEKFFRTILCCNSIPKSRLSLFYKFDFTLCSPKIQELSHSTVLKPSFKSAITAKNKQLQEVSTELLTITTFSTESLTLLKVQLNLYQFSGKQNTPIQPQFPTFSRRVLKASLSSNFYRYANNFSGQTRNVV